MNGPQTSTEEGLDERPFDTDDQLYQEKQRIGQDLEGSGGLFLWDSPWGRCPEEESGRGRDPEQFQPLQVWYRLIRS